MFERTAEEFEIWRSQFVTSKRDKMGLRYKPMITLFFTIRDSTPFPILNHRQDPAMIIILTEEVINGR
jgi:hypothetical protein